MLTTLFHYQLSLLEMALLGYEDMETGLYEIKHVVYAYGLNITFTFVFCNSKYPIIALPTLS